MMIMGSVAQMIVAMRSAMGGGSDLLKLDDALATVDDFVAEKLK